MPDKPLSRVRYDEAFWRAHHEAWRQSELNQREYCEAQGIPLNGPRFRQHARVIGAGSAKRTNARSLRRRCSRARAFPRWRVAMG